MVIPAWLLVSGTNHTNKKKKGKGRSVSACLSFLHAMARLGCRQRREIGTVTNQLLPIGARTRFTVKTPRSSPRQALEVLMETTVGTAPLGFAAVPTPLACQPI